MRDIDFSKFYTLRGAAKFCEVSPNAIRNWILTGKLHAPKGPNGRYYIHEDDLVAAMDERKREEAMTAEGSV